MITRPESAPASSGDGPAVATRPPSWGRHAGVVVAVAVLCLVAVVTLGRTVGHPWRIASNAMAPTYADGTTVVVLPTSEVARGDVIVFTAPEHWDVRTGANPGWFERASARLRFSRPVSGTLVVSRVVGVPGDEVRCCSAAGALIVNGTILPTPDSSGRTSPDFRVVVPTGRLFVTGDARATSVDSRCYLAQLGQDALVPVGDVVGVVRPAWWGARSDDPVRGPYNGASPGGTPPSTAVIESAKDRRC